MAEKRVSVRLAVVGGRQVRAELEGVGEAGSRGFGRLGREMEAANARLAAFSRRVDDRDRGRDRRRGRRRRGDDPLRARTRSTRRRSSRSRSAPPSPRSRCWSARASWPASSMSGIEQATKDLTAPAEPGGLRRRSRGRGARPARALGLRAAGAAARRAGRPRSTRRSPTSCPRPSAPRSPASSSARKARSPCRASTPRRCARRPRTCATSASWSPRRTPTDRAHQRRDLAARADLARALEPAGGRRRPGARSGGERHGRASPAPPARSASRSAGSSTTSAGSRPTPPPSPASWPGAGSPGWSPRRSRCAGSPRRWSCCAAR